VISGAIANNSSRGGDREPFKQFDWDASTEMGSLEYHSFPGSKG
jgi:hypothetical protein